MRNTKCDNCGQTFTTNETFKVTDKILCRPCAEQFLKTQKNIPANQAQIQHDPTICINCGKDNGDWELKKMAGLPTCEQCAAFFKNRPYPTWLSFAMLGLVAIVILSFAWNWRFVQAYIDIRTTKTYIKAGDFATTAKLFKSAAEKVPEVKGISAMASFYQGITFLKENKSVEALKLFNSCRANIPSSFPIEEMIANAEVGVAFDNKDYDKFLAIATQLSEKYPDDPRNMAQISSAYACKYAVTGDEQFKKQSLEYLEKAKSMSQKKNGLNEFAEYEDRILYRLETRDIISRDDFKKKFHNGWKKQKEQSK
jgi:hypothetical protein